MESMRMKWYCMHYSQLAFFRIVIIFTFKLQITFYVFLNLEKKVHNYCIFFSVETHLPDFTEGYCSMPHVTSVTSPIMHCCFSREGM